MSTTTTSRIDNARTMIGTTVGRKFLTGITGVLLVVYLIQHMLANVRIFGSDPQGVSKYGVMMEGFGPLVRIVEIVLLLLIVVHVVVGIRIWLRKRQARTVDYDRYQSAGRPSRQTIASRTMIVSGLLVLVFLVIHVAYFRFGKGIAEGYSTTIDNVAVLNYERLVIEHFESIPMVIFYSIVMIVLGFHLSHGFWSAFQSLGLITEKNEKGFYWTGIVVSAAVTIGFLAIPWWVLLRG